MRKKSATRIMAVLLALCMVPAYIVDRAEAQQQIVGQTAAFTASADGELNEANLPGRIKQYLDGDRPALSPCPGYHLSRTGKLVLEEGQEFPLNLIDSQGQAVTEDVKWYVFMTVPFDKLFTAEDSLVDESPMSSGGETYQKDSLVKIDTDRHTITARNNTGVNTYGNKKETFGWVVAVYQGKYAHVLSVDVKNKDAFDKDREIEKVTAEVLKATKNMSDPDKVAYVFDYLCDKITYTDSESGRYTLYNTLVKGKAVCEGYAKAFYHLMDQMGIRAEYKVGDTISGGVQGESNGASHAWNRVMLDDGWYYLDVTWGDTSSRNYAYLFAERDFMAESRELNDDGQKIGTKYLHYCPTDKNDPFTKSYNGQSWEEQLTAAQKVWHPGENTFYIYLYKDDQTDVVNVNNKIDNMKFITREGPAGYEIPVKDGERAVVCYQYTISYTPDSVTDVMPS